MKRIFLITAFVIGFGVAANAQADQTTTKTTTETSTTKQYKSIDRNTVSPTALEKIGTKYGGYSILEAFQAPDGEYKLIVSKDNKKSTAYFNSTGEFLKEE